jgi:hypothetical protein
MPPEFNLVVIYFREKGRSQHQANGFYEFYSGRKWKNKQGIQYKNWKKLAWEWILNSP